MTDYIVKVFVRIINFTSNFPQVFLFLSQCPMLNSNPLVFDQDDKMCRTIKLKYVKDINIFNEIIILFPSST